MLAHFQNNFTINTQWDGVGVVRRKVCGDACTHVEVKLGARYLSLSISTLVVDISSPTEPGAPKSRDLLVSALLMLELQECSAAQLDIWLWDPTGVLIPALEASSRLPA